MDLCIESTFLSFGETLDYEYRHCRFHHPYLGDYERDNEIPDACGDFLVRHVGKTMPGNERILFWLRTLLAFVPLSFLIEAKVIDSVAGVLGIPVAYTDRARWWRKQQYPASVVGMMHVFRIYDVCAYAAIAYFLGWRSVMYQLVTLSIYSNHLFSVWRRGQGAAEHNTWDDEKPSNSWYSPFFNTIFFNTGHHDEHHTFPTVPASRLRVLHRTCPEFFGAAQGTELTGTCIYLRLWWKNISGGFRSYRTSEDIKKFAEGGRCERGGDARETHAGTPGHNSVWWLVIFPGCVYLGCQAIAMVA